MQLHVLTWNAWGAVVATVQCILQLEWPILLPSVIFA